MTRIVRPSPLTLALLRAKKIRAAAQGKGFWQDHWIFEKFASDEDYAANNPYEIAEVVQGNLLLNSGINELWPLVSGASANHFDNTNARIGVGDSTTAAAAAQTDLQAAVNKTYVAMEATFPTTGASQKITFKSVFGSASANYSWQEFVAKQNVSAICLNRLVSDQGTKASGQTWTVTLEVTLS